MAWKLVEVADDEEGEGTLTDWELIGVKVSLESTSRSDPDTPWAKIWAKLWPHFAKAIENGKSEAGGRV